jgi:signal peptidase I
MSKYSPEFIEQMQHLYSEDALCFYTPVSLPEQQAQNLFNQIDNLIAETTHASSQNVDIAQKLPISSIKIAVSYSDKTVKTVAIAVEDETHPHENTGDALVAQASSPVASNALPTQNTRNPLRQQQRTPVRHSSLGSKLSGFFFYFILISLVVLALLSTGKCDQPRSLVGVAIFTVLTRSMQSEIPQYSFIITRNVASESLKIGDDITYLLEDGRTITHRIVAVYSNYLGTGEIAFETQGVDNPAPDEEIVYGKNVVGKVIFHSLTIGKVIRFISMYWNLLIIPAVTVVVGLYIIMRIYGKRVKRQ